MWRLRSILIASVTAAALAPTEPLAAPSVFEVAPRPSVALLLTYGSQGGIDTGDTTRVLEAFDRALEETTGLVRTRIAFPFTDRCAQDFSVLDLCSFEALFGSVSSTVDEAGRAPSVAVASILEAPDAPRLVFNVAVAQDASGRKVARFRVFSSTTAAAVIARARGRLRPGERLDRDALQLELTESTVRRIKRRGVRSLSDPELYRGVLAEVEPLTRAFGRRAELRIPAGALPDGATIAFDARALEAVTSEGLRLTGVPAGVHTIELSAPGYEPLQLPVTVIAGESRTLRPRLRSKLGLAVREGTLYAGLGLTAGGVVAMSMGAANSANFVCFVRDPEQASACPESGGAGFLPPDASSPDDLSPTVSATAVGSALLGAGVSWTLGALLWGEEDEIPWGPIIIGVAAGIVAGGAVVGAQSL